MRISNSDQFNPHPLSGDQQVILHSPDGEAVDGDREPYKDAPVGSVLTRTPAAGHSQTLVKVKDDEADNDWAVIRGVIAQTVAFGDFTDGGGTTGTLDLSADIPAGGVVHHVTVRDVTGFTGDTSATLTVGDGSDVDRYNTGTPSVFATASWIDMGPPSGGLEHTAAQTVTLTVTSGADFTSVAAGALTIYVHYTI